MNDDGRAVRIEQRVGRVAVQRRLVREDVGARHAPGPCVDVGQVARVSSLCRSLAVAPALEIEVPTRRREVRLAGPDLVDVEPVAALRQPVHVRLDDEAVRPLLDRDRPHVGPVRPFHPRRCRGADGDGLVRRRRGRLQRHDLAPQVQPRLAHLQVEGRLRCVPAAPLDACAEVELRGLGSALPDRDLHGPSTGVNGHGEPAHGRQRRQGAEQDDQLLSHAMLPGLMALSSHGWGSTVPTRPPP